VLGSSWLHFTRKDRPTSSLDFRQEQQHQSPALPSPGRVSTRSHLRPSHCSRPSRARCLFPFAAAWSQAGFVRSPALLGPRSTASPRPSQPRALHAPASIRQYGPHLPLDRVQHTSRFPPRPLRTADPVHSLLLVVSQSVVSASPGFRFASQVFRLAPCLRLVAVVPGKCSTNHPQEPLFTRCSRWTRSTSQRLLFRLLQLLGHQDGGDATFAPIRDSSIRSEPYRKFVLLFIFGMR
jgi:hypothetical protein